MNERYFQCKGQAGYSLPVTREMLYEYYKDLR